MGGSNLFADALIHQHVGIYGHAEIFPDPPLPAADLQAKLTAFTKALDAQAQGGSQTTAAKDQARSALIAALRELALYVQTVIQKNPAFGLAELLLSGFDAVSNNRAQTQLGAPTITGIDNTGESRLTLRVTAGPNVRMFAVEKRADGETAYSPAGLFGSTRGMEVTGLTPGVLYTFRVRALGGSTGKVIGAIQ